MKKLTLIASAVALGAAVHAAPLFTIGDQVDVFFNGTVKGTWNSNIYWSQNKTDDYIYTFRLGAEANYGRNSKFKASVKFYEDINRYISHTGANNDLANVFANMSYTEDRWYVAAKFSFQQLAQNTETTNFTNDLGELVRSDSYNASLNGSYSFTDKISADLGFYWMRQEYTNYQYIYSNQDQYRIPVSALYKITEKISAGLTYQYRNTEYTGGSQLYSGQYGSSTSDHFAGVTVRGELSPKLSSEIFLGYSVRDMNNAQSTSDSTFSFSAKFDYLLTDKVTTFVKAARDFGNGAARQSSINTTVEAGVAYAYSQYISTHMSARYGFSDYIGSLRQDDNYSLNLGVTYSPNRFISLGAAYRYLDNASNLNGCSYMAHIVDLNFTVRY